MRIAYIINSVEGGGAALPVPSIARALSEAGAEVRVFALTRRDGRALAAMEAEGLDPLVRDGGSKDHLHALRWIMREVRAWRATHLWTSLSRATSLGLLAGPALGLPVVSWQHAAFLKPWNLRLLRLLQSRAMLWVADSQTVATFAQEHIGISADRLAIWPIYAVDPAMPIARPRRDGEVLRIGSLGRLHPVKGYDVLIEALAHLRQHGFTAPVPWVLDIAGEGEERDRLQSLARAAGLSDFRLPGYVEDPKRFLASCHLYVQPSRSEGFCIAGHEAMTAGLPIIASRVGELAASVRPDTTGWLCSPQSPAALAECLRQALSHPERFPEMGRAARADMLERFSPRAFSRTGRVICERIRR
ncbi:glycosyltransferase family 4 protein [Novosphingobium sp.]|jgi:glycosyltransferase involved in cell wall biosynthesis|uniref:glycosyltransferase family 4 protein n=1 Tax=Novosphingobium sp. TaxID=1874826 RepID=UPI002FDF4D70